MRRGSVSLVILLAAVAAAGLDLTTFRQSYSRASRAGWYVSGSSDASGWIGAPALSAAGAGGAAYWRTAVLSDNFDLDVELPSSVTAAALDGTGSDTTVVTGSRLVATFVLHPTATSHVYLPGTDAFVQAGLDAYVFAGSNDERYGSARARTRTTDFDLRVVQLGLGYGRMRDAWPLYKAARLARILEEEDALTHRLSDDELADLGGFISRSWKLFYAHERAAKFYYDSLEQWLMHAGAIREPLSAYTLFRLDETPLIGSDERRFGMRTFFVAGADARRLTTVHDGTDTVWTELTAESGQSYQVGWEFCGLSGLRWTYGASAAYTLPWPYLPDSGMRHQAVLTGSASYDLTDRLVASYGLDLEPQYQGPAGAGGNARFLLPSAQTVTFSCYLSERFAVRLGGSYSTDFELPTEGSHGQATFTHRWAAALTLTFGRIPPGWGVYYYQ